MNGHIGTALALTALLSPDYPGRAGPARIGSKTKRSRKRRMKAKAARKTRAKQRRTR
jgi:hypothetical protein